MNQELSSLMNGNIAFNFKCFSDILSTYEEFLYYKTDLI